LKKIAGCSDINHVKSLGDCLLKAGGKWDMWTKKMRLLFVNNNEVDNAGENIVVNCLAKFVWYCTSYAEFYNVIARDYEEDLCA
jgi:hypothetical protein